MIKRDRSILGIVSLSWLSISAAAGQSSIAILPGNMTLTGPRASQRILLEAQKDGRYAGDLTARAQFSSSNPRVAQVNAAGIVRPVSDGAATISATVNGQTARADVNVANTHAPFTWSFRNHVLPVLTKATCNSGACHGALAGKGGLKLTLRGFDPLADWGMFTRQTKGRRVVERDPAHSLMLLKPTMSIGHGGGERIKKTSLEYDIVAGWISAGALAPQPDDPKLQKLEVFPEAATLKPGDTQQILVRADYSDGHSEDVTRWVKFGTSDGSVAAVDDDGKAKATGSGEAAITIWFSSKVAFARITSPYLSVGDSPQSTLRTAEEKPTPPGGPGASSASSATSAVIDSSFIDELIRKKLELLNIPASPRCSDSEFIRRAFLDAAGILPSIAEVKAFLNDASADKRTVLVDSLLARPEWVDYWTYKWCDLLLVSSRKLSGKGMTTFYNWIHDSVHSNKPWNQFAREILTARGSTVDNGPANYFLLHKEPIELTETTTQAFLGMSIQCAHCHNHPLEKWTQRDYYQMANLMSRVRLKNGEQGDVLVLASSDGNINHPRLGIPLPPRPLDGQEISLDDTRDRREYLAGWMTSPNNPYFAKALVNRVWRNFMGRGLVEAEDDLRLTNPPSNQELFDALAADFIAHGFDFKRLVRQIMITDAYQRSSVPLGVNAKDDRYYSHYLVKRLPAEVILDAVARVTGVPTEYEGYPRGTRALQLRDSQVSSYFLAAFGRPERIQTCSCERMQEPNVAQALHLVNGDTINLKLRSPGGIVEQLFNSQAGDEEVVSELFLSALARYPTVSERTKLFPILGESPIDVIEPFAQQKAARRAALEDLYWAVLTDRDFLFNH